MPEPCACHEEIASLHRFFEDWFRGKTDPADFSECEEALAPGFTIITPAGTLLERDEILGAIRRHRGGEPDDFRIETVPRTCRQVRGLHLSTYEERQFGARSTIRLSTAVIGEAEGRLRWYNVHETWITSV